MNRTAQRTPPPSAGLDAERRLRILVTQPTIGLHGGGDALAAWTLQALRDLGEVTLVAFEPPDCGVINRYYGTSLHPGDFRFERVPLPWWSRAIPTRSYLLRIGLVLRHCRRLDRRQPYDVLLSTNNEVDFGRRGVQYVHAPRAFAEAPREEWSWYHHLPGALRGYRAFIRLLSGASEARALENLTLVNSEFIAGEVRKAYGISSIVLYPPVPGDFPTVGWDDRADAIVCLGRLHPCKRLVEIIEIVDRLRTRGSHLRLTMIGSRDDVPAYEVRLREMAAARSEWLTLHVALPRAEMVQELSRHRYAIHAMVGEHFGIAVGEMVRAGCIPFVHDSGGPPAIVGGDRRLRFTSVEDAVAAIERVVARPDLQQELLAGLAERRELYSEQHFMAGMRQVVERFARSEL